MTILSVINSGSSLADHPGAMRMQEIDPHGITLSLVAVMVVFSALVVLFLIYNLSGNIFSGKFKRKRKNSVSDAETAAAIALSLEKFYSDDASTAAAVAAALHLYIGESVHDIEPGIIKIRRNEGSEWRNKSLIFRKKP